MIEKSKKIKPMKRYSKKQIIRNRIITCLFIAIFLFCVLKFISPLFYNNVSLTSAPNEDDLSNNIASQEESNEAVPTHNDIDIIPNNNITYGGEKYAFVAEDVEKMVKGQNIDDKKYVFLTFDDGPSNNTEKILDILKEKDAKATFFVLGTQLEKGDKLKQILKRCISEGNAIANHTYSHEPSKIYPHSKVNCDIYLNEFNKTNDLIKGVLGSDFNSRITRMPGGRCTRVHDKDPNLPAFEEMLKKNNIIDIDWTALNSDAEGPHYTPEQLLENSKKNSKGQKQIVILMHDTDAKGNTVKMLPALIDYFRENGYEFKTIKSSNANTDTK